MQESILQLKRFGDDATRHVSLELVQQVYHNKDQYEEVAWCLRSQQNKRWLQQVLFSLDLIHAVDETAVCARFAFFNNLPVLQYLYRQGLEWDYKTLFSSIVSNSLDCLKFALEKQCPTSITNEELLTYVLQHGNKECLYLFCSHIQNTMYYCNDFWKELALLQTEAHKRDCLLHFANSVE